MYEWLKDYQQLMNDIDYLHFQLEQNETELKRWTSGDLFNVRLNEDSIASGLEERIEKIKDEIVVKVKQKDQMVQLVSTFKGLDNKILKMKYIDGMTLENIAEALNYSASHIRKRHAELVRTIKFLEMYHSCSLT
ncbi:sigma factor-like helix-turn-helix DNA-binding protein [Ornithinibacillus salinisoli]|uniref:Sigma factor-like helix-turn-helix DNA-binding protein n=1 Tax=Ornithinibacillus salinisoli TaxID=1848459 RepID=A0ABW4W3A7_9BACI